MIVLLIVLWLLAMAPLAIVVFAAAAGKPAPLSRLSRRAMALGMRRVPVWLQRPVADRWVARGGAAAMVLLTVVGVALLVVPFGAPPVSTPEAPPVASAPAPAPTPDRSVFPPPPPRETITTLNAQPDRSMDDELKKSIQDSVPKSKRISFMILSGEGQRERIQFADQVRDFLQTSGYVVVLPYRYFMFSGATPRGLTAFPDDKNPDVWVMRVGVNDR